MRSLVKYGVTAVVIGSVLSRATTPSSRRKASSRRTCSQARRPGMQQPRDVHLPARERHRPRSGHERRNQIVINGTADDILTCSVIPNGDNFDLSIIAQITGGIAPARFTSRVASAPQAQRDPNGNPTPAGDARRARASPSLPRPLEAPQPNDCFAQYVLADNGSPGLALPVRPIPR